MVYCYIMLRKKLYLFGGGFDPIPSSLQSLIVLWAKHYSNRKHPQSYETHPQT